MSRRKTSLAMVNHVYYFIAEDGDDEKHPNVYTLPSGSDVDFGLIQRTFPVAAVDGEVFVFRFKFPWKKGYVWLDLASPDDALPLFNGRLIMKVSRMATDGVSSPPPQRGTASSGHSRPASTTAKSSASSPLALDSSQDEVSVPEQVDAEPAPAQAPKARAESVDFFNESPATGHNAAQAQAQEEADFFSATHHAPAPAPAPAPIDFFAHSADANSSTASPAPSADTHGDLLDLDFSAVSASPSPAPAPAPDSGSSSPPAKNDMFNGMMFQM